tara:strand:+ start:17822 stop:18040 length:219 start_codon:yes stop_codon:yes gene_type:complete
MLGIVYNGVAFPLLFSMLKKGEIQTAKSESIVVDREFVGGRWLGFLNDNNLKYYIRIRLNFKVFIPHKGQEI